MRITKSFEYPAGPDEVFAMVTDKSFQERKCEATHPLSHTVTVTPNADGAEITTRRVMSTAGIPDFVKSLAGDQLTLVEQVVWGRAQADGSRRGSLEVTVDKAPMSMTGTVALTPTASGSRFAVDGELKARIPLIGGQIEKAAAPALLAALDAEQQTGTAWLTAR